MCQSSSLPMIGVGPEEGRAVKTARKSWIVSVAATVVLSCGNPAHKSAHGERGSDAAESEGVDAYRAADAVHPEDLAVDRAADTSDVHSAAPDEDVSLECPTAVIECAHGAVVPTYTVLKLVGDESYAAQGTVTKWKWDVDQPAGSQSVFVPSSTFPNPTFEVKVAGQYTFRLLVCDSSGTPSCFPAVHQVTGSDEGIRVEVTWQTIEDPESVEQYYGVDIDLHLLHPWAEGAGRDVDGDGTKDGWCDVPFDCFSSNPTPNWGSYDPALNDDPQLDWDLIGPGPEAITLSIPEEVTYRVGVLYRFDGFSFGPSEATLRVLLYGQEVFEAKTVLEEHDFWEVCTIDWAIGDVQLVTTEAGEHKISAVLGNFCL